MSKYQNLFNYLSYFENITIDEVCHWDGGKKNAEGVITIPYPICGRKLIDFISTESKSINKQGQYYSRDCKTHEYILSRHTTNEEKPGWINFSFPIYLAV